MESVRRVLAAVFAGDRRVWRVAAISAVPLVLLSAFYCLQPRFYYTGTNSVEDLSYLNIRANEPVCVPGLQLPAQTAFLRLRIIPPTQRRPSLHVALREGTRTIASALPAVQVAPRSPSNADFPIPVQGQPSRQLISLCVVADGPLKLGGTQLTKPGDMPPTTAGTPIAARVAIWYLPRTGARRSYLQRADEIFSRAALFRPGIVGAWTYPFILFLVLPATALMALRCIALAVAGRARRLGVWLFVVAALNASCWALITPVFQGPDEVDHFAYVQSLVERGEGPSHDPASPLQRWSGSENRALEDISLFTDHQVGDTKPPWLPSEQRRYDVELALRLPHTNDGGGYTTSAAHGPLYYLALAPAYLATRNASVFSQLTLMRISSALLGALVVLFTFLLVRELAPGRPWLAVFAALLVAYEPMYGFVSGIVNNDVGVNAAAAGLELLLIRMLRRGITIPWGLLTGAVLIALPLIKGTGLSLYPVAALVFAAALWRHHSRRDLYAWAALAVGGLLVGEISTHVLSELQPAASATGTGAISSNATAVTEALHHIPNYLAYLWETLLPRLPFMGHYFYPSVHPGFVLFNDPGFVIFVERGWGAFGWYVVFFPKWVYVAIFLAMVAAAALGVWGARREWAWVRAHALEVVALLAIPVAVIMGFVAAYYDPHPRVLIPEFGRYVFPAIGPIAALVVGALHALPRRRMLTVAVGLLVAMIGLSYASQLLTLTSFYA